MTQADMILERLERGEMITPLLAFQLTGSLACHSRIAELRERGHEIECRMMTRGRKRWGEYRLVKREPQRDLFDGAAAQVHV